MKQNIHNIFETNVEAKLNIYGLYVFIYVVYTYRWFHVERP